jgi:hypothetical protein
MLGGLDKAAEPMQFGLGSGGGVGVAHWGKTVLDDDAGAAVGAAPSWHFGRRLAL